MACVSGVLICGMEEGRGYVVACGARGRGGGRAVRGRASERERVEGLRGRGARRASAASAARRQEGVRRRLRGGGERRVRRLRRRLGPGPAVCDHAEERRRRDHVPDRVTRNTALTSRAGGAAIIEFRSPAAVGEGGGDQARRWGG